MTSLENLLEDSRRSNPLSHRAFEGVTRTPEGDATFKAIVATTRQADERRLAPGRVRRARARTAVAVAAVLAIAITVTIMSGVIPGTDTPAFAVRQLPNGVIEIENVADIHDPRGLEAELREFGIDAEIVTEPSSPSLVGHAEAFTPDLGSRKLEGLDFGPDGSQDVFRWRIDPREFDGKIIIKLFVEAHPGEPYLNGVDVFSPGEVLSGLHCELGVPLRASEVSSRMADLGMTSRWLVLTSFRSEGDGGVTTEEPSEAVPQGVIMSSQPINDHTVEFKVLPDGVSAPQWLKPTYADIPCSGQ